MIERVFYRLPDLAERWGCTVHDLLHLGIQNRAQVCMNIYGLATGMRAERLETDAPEPAPEPVTEEERREAEAPDSACERWKARTVNPMPHGVFELGDDELRFLDVPGAFPREVHEALKFDHRGWWAYEFDPPVQIDLEHLCMLHAEVQRLDREVIGAGAQAIDAQGASAQLGSRAETTYLNIIGALLELVRSPRPGRESDAAVIRELIENYSDKPGISKATLEAKFAEARRRLLST